MNKNDYSVIIGHSVLQRFGNLMMLQFFSGLHIA